MTDNLFDETESKLAKEQGMGLAASNRDWVLRQARNAAAEIANSRESKCCTADDVARAMLKLGYLPAQLGNAAGSVFRGNRWRFTGRWIPSTRVGNHARMIRVWQFN